MARELEIERACLTWLNQNGYYAWKIKSVGTYDVGAGAFRKLSPFEIRGVADSCALAPGGITIWIEYKSATGTQSKWQKIFQERVEKMGGIYLLIRSVGELQCKLQECGQMLQSAQPSALK